MGSTKKLQNVDLEEALELTGTGKFTYVILAFCSLLMLGMMLETMGYGFVVAASVCDLDLSTSSKTWLASVPFLGFVASCHMWGYIADRYGRKRAMLLSTSIGAAISIVSSLAPNLVTFMVLRVAAAFFISGGAALGYAFLGELTPRSRRDLIITLANAAVATGPGVASLLAWGVLEFKFRLPFWMGFYRPWRVLQAVFALPYLSCAIWCFAIPESPKFLSAVGKNEEALNVLKKMFRLNTGRHEDDYLVESLQTESAAAVEKGFRNVLSNMWNQCIETLRPPVLRYTLLLSFMQFLVYGISNGYNIWIGEAVTKVLGAADSQVSSRQSFCNLLTNSSQTDAEAAQGCNDSLRPEAFIINVILAGIMALVTVLCAVLTPKLGKRRITFGLTAIEAGMVALLLVIKVPQAAVFIFAALQLAGSLIGFLNAFAVDVYPTHIRAIGVCTCTLWGRVGSVLFTKVLGELLPRSCSGAFLLTLGLLLLMFFSIFLLPKDSKSSQKT